MKITLGALTKLHEDWKAVDDFYIYFQLDVEVQNEKSGFELFSLIVISPKRLEAIIPEKGIEFGRGYVIMTNFDIRVLENSIKRILTRCTTDTLDKTIDNISKFFQYEGDVL